MNEWEQLYIESIQTNIINIATNDFGLNMSNIKYAIYRTFSDRISYHNIIGDTNIFHGTSSITNDPYTYSQNDLITLIDRAAVIMNGGKQYLTADGTTSSTTTIKRTVIRTNEKNNTDTGTVTADNTTNEITENSPIGYTPKYDIEYPNEKGNSKSNSTTERNLSSVNTESGNETLNNTHSFNNMSSHDKVEALKFIAEHGNVMIPVIHEIVDRYYIEHLAVY